MFKLTLTLTKSLKVTVLLGFLLAGVGHIYLGFIERGIINHTGTIEPYKQADMLILSANPIEDIENIGKIDAVISDARIVEK